MLEYTAPASTATSLAFLFSTTVGFAAGAYPVLNAPYEIRRDIGTHSAFLGELAASNLRAEQFSTQLATLYSDFVRSQRPLGELFERAIFTNLEALYEE